MVQKIAEKFRDPHITPSPLKRQVRESFLSAQSFHQGQCSAAYKWRGDSSVCVTSWKQTLSRHWFITGLLIAR